MAWIKIDDQMADHPKFAELAAPFGPLALALQVRALCYAARHLTDGRIPASIVPGLLAGFSELDIATGEIPGIAEFGDSADTWDWPAMMVRAGLWDEADGGFLIHDYLDYNPSKRDVLKERKGWKERQQKSRRDTPRDTDRESQGESFRPVPVPVPGSPPRTTGHNAEGEVHLGLRGSTFPAAPRVSADAVVSNSSTDLNRNGGRQERGKDGPQRLTLNDLPLPTPASGA